MMSLPVGEKDVRPSLLLSSLCSWLLPLGRTGFRNGSNALAFPSSIGPEQDSLRKQLGVIPAFM